MPLDPAAETVLSAFREVPPIARGLVRDLRVRWALEEIDRPYRTELLVAFAPRPDGYRDRQPFGQVPAFRDGGMELFESGAILLYLGEQDERLLPREPAARWSAIAWAFAALNTVETPIAPLLFTDVIHRDAEWAKPAREPFIQWTRRRLGDVQDALGDKEWLAGPFSIADILMVTVLRQLDRKDELPAFPALAAYKARAEARPAFVRALADHLAAFEQPATGEPA